MNNEYRKDTSYIKQRLEYVAPVDYISELEEKIDNLQQKIDKLEDELEWYKQECDDLALNGGDEK